jgi:hypothetical protein
MSKQHEQSHSKKDRPLCIRTRENEPNMELMAKAFTNLYYKTRNYDKVESA